MARNEAPLYSNRTATGAQSAGLGMGNVSPSGVATGVGVGQATGGKLGFGIGLGTGLAIKTPFGDIVQGQGQSISVRK